MPKGAFVIRIDDTSKIVNGICWYHVEVYIKTKKYTGYCSAKYLSKV
jgi:hypothetical protein